MDEWRDPDQRREVIIITIPAEIRARRYTVDINSTALLSATSNAVTLTVNRAGAVAPTITTQPASQTISTGQTATFNVAATGTSPMTYQWKNGTTAISGATSSSYTTPAETTGATFSVTVSNSAGSVTSNAAVLTAEPRRSRGSQQSRHNRDAKRYVIRAINPLTFTTTVGANPAAYQWKRMAR